MKISFHWLQEFVEIPWAPRELAERLTMAGVEVEGVEAVRPAFEKVVVGRIKDIRPSHQAEGLLLCQVDVGTSVLPILCGARNISAGNFVPVALPGALLPGGRRIEEAIIHGERSAGMLCSEQELGLGEEGSGILILEGDLRPGLDLAGALELEDSILEVAVTPNRGDCLSHLGIAREVAALTGGRVRPTGKGPRENGPSITRCVQVRVDAKDLCRRYAARVVQGGRVGPSPFWLRRRLSLAGVRPVNNVVDATNYVMLETGQPLHPFDLARLAERRIIVRRARAEERITTLDGQERTLGPDVLAICDARSPVAVAGIMGGIDSAVTDRTQEILLESASFDPVSVRRTGRELALASESAYRFERGVDPGGTGKALDRVAQLVTDVAGGRVARGVLDMGEPIRRDEITLRHGRVPTV
ncbi:MAG: phenylalanine--tRNA ligase subunit beta, partial [Candidatus Methylomirabilales bacterium]